MAFGGAAGIRFAPGASCENAARRTDFYSRPTLPSARTLPPQKPTRPHEPEPPARDARPSHPYAQLADPLPPMTANASSIYFLPSVGKPSISLRANQPSPAHKTLGGPCRPVLFTFSRSLLDSCRPKLLAKNNLRREQLDSDPLFLIHLLQALPLPTHKGFSQNAAIPQLPFRAESPPLQPSFQRTLVLLLRTKYATNSTYMLSIK